MLRKRLREHKAEYHVVKNTLFKRAIVGRLPLSHLIGLVLLALLMPASPFLSPLVLAAAAIFVQWTLGVLLGLALWLGMTALFCARRLRATSREPGHILEMAVTSALIPPLAVFWRLQGAWRFRVAFL